MSCFKIILFLFVGIRNLFVKKLKMISESFNMLI